MGDFDCSSQAKSWLFDGASLSVCRQHRAECRVGPVPIRVQKFASGFHRRQWNKQQDENRSSGVNTMAAQYRSKKRPYGFPDLPPPNLTEAEEEALLRFHANQIQALVGPRAIHVELRRSPKVLATAIMLFRRFYLSNSVLDFDCRHMAVASALLASKVESSEERIQACFLSHATAYIHQHAKDTPLYGNELQSVLVKEIEAAERVLLEGLNYELCCHHSTDTVRALSVELASFLANKNESRDDNTKTANAIGKDVHDRALAICYRALVSTDAIFLFAPDPIAWAAVALALQSLRSTPQCYELSGTEMGEFLCYKYPNKSQQEITSMKKDMSDIGRFLKECPPMELDPPQIQESSSNGSNTWKEAEELWYVLAKLYNIYSFKPPTSFEDETVMPPRKHRRCYDNRKVPPRRSARLSGLTMRGCPVVTPSLSQSKF